MLNKAKVVLASASPRRRELLSKIGIDFEIITSSVEEKATQTEPDKVVEELSYIKAQDVLHQIIGNQDCDLKSDNNAIIVIGADTVVSQKGIIMGKPKSEDEAFDMIHSIEGSTHQVYTGVTVLTYHWDTKKIESKSFVERTDVIVSSMTDDEIKNYIATGDCMDKAGAYGIQGPFGVFVKEIHGDYNNVVGLPVARLYQELKKLVFMEQITKALFELQDKEYRNFHAKLMPTIEFDNIIGVRTPELRKYAKKVAQEPYAKDFLEELPHRYYEENNLHGALLNLLYKDVEELLEKIEEFLPYVDNWATCDMMSPKAFKKSLPLVYEHVKQWLKSDNTYTVRFGVVTLLGYFLDDAFEPEMLELVANIKSEEYYINMAIAWYFSIALVKQYNTAIPYFTNPKLEPWTHNKALQKATESRRISDETKKYLRNLKIKK